MRSTNSLNSATILIADRRGRDELSKAIRRLPSAMQKRFTQALSGDEAATDPSWNPSVQRGIAAVLAGLCLLIIWLVFTRAW